MSDIATKTSLTNITDETLILMKIMVGDFAADYSAKVIVGPSLVFM
jgi:hypothetical protein